MRDLNQIQNTMPSKKHIQQKIRELEHKLYELRGMYEEHYKENASESADLYKSGYDDALKQVTDFINSKKEKSK